MTVKLIRMWSGEDVIADLVEEKGDSIVITNPIVAIPAQQGQIGFAPWSPLISEKVKDLEVIKKYVVYFWLLMIFSIFKATSSASVASSALTFVLFESVRILFIKDTSSS